MRKSLCSHKYEQGATQSSDIHGSATYLKMVVAVKYDIADRDEAGVVEIDKDKCCK